MSTIQLTAENYEEVVTKAATPVVIDFWAEWCGPCGMIGPALEELSAVFAGKVAIAKLNVDENREIAARFGIRSIPTLALVRNGAVADIKVGAAHGAILRNWIEAAL